MDDRYLARRPLVARRVQRRRERIAVDGLQANLQSFAA
jgi:hypothetical protein